MIGGKSVVTYINNYYRNTKDNVLCMRECTRRRTLAFPSKTAAREISYSMEWICANGLHDNCTSIIHVRREEELESRVSLLFRTAD